MATASTLLEGFKILKVSLKNPDSGEILWTTGDDLAKIKNEYKVHLSSSFYEKSINLMLEIVFSSSEAMENFRIEKRILYKNICLEEWSIEFGQIKEKSINTRQIMLAPSPNVNNMPFDALSGHLIIESKYFDQKVEFNKTLSRIFYDCTSSS